MKQQRERRESLHTEARSEPKRHPSKRLVSWANAKNAREDDREPKEPGDGGAPRVTQRHEHRRREGPCNKECLRRREGTQNREAHPRDLHAERQAQKRTRNRKHHRHEHRGEERAEAKATSHKSLQIVRISIALHLGDEGKSVNETLATSW